MNPISEIIVPGNRKNPYRCAKPWALIGEATFSSEEIVGFADTRCSIVNPSAIARRSHKMSLMSLRLYGAGIALAGVVDIDQRKCGGAPVLKGTRMQVSQIIAQIADGDSVATLADEFSLDPEKIRTVLRCLSDFLARPIANEDNSV